MENKIILNNIQRAFYNKIINTPIEELGLSWKVFFSLLRTKFFTIYDLMNIPNDYLCNIIGFDFKEIEEVEDKLKEKYDFLNLCMSNKELKETIFNMPSDEIMNVLNQNKNEKGRQYTLGNLK